MMLKGIILAGGHGTRLWPMTKAVNKHVLPIYDKPMIHYPLATLMLAGIRDILVVSSPEAIPQLNALLGDGADYGVRISYREQPRPAGVAEALTIGADFVDGDRFCLVLGDNVFYGNDFSFLMQDAAARNRSTVFAYYLTDPSGLGVCEFGPDWTPLRLVEKPNGFVSNWVVPGLYFYEPEAIEIAAALKPSARGEYEITDLNIALLDAGRLDVMRMGRGMLWLDCGTPENLLEASEFVRVVEKRVGLQICCLEEIAFTKGYIDAARLSALAAAAPSESQQAYLERLLMPAGDRK
jgi:glucose-1-phosphate thymidylyltransferase